MFGTRWQEKRVLIAVRTYPTPAAKGAETSCTAGITEDGEWIRLFPINYRQLEPEQKFHKYDWVTVRVAKASDPTPRKLHGRSRFDSCCLKGSIQGQMASPQGDRPTARSTVAVRAQAATRRVRSPNARHLQA